MLAGEWMPAGGTGTQHAVCVGPWCESILMASGAAGLPVELQAQVRAAAGAGSETRWHPAFQANVLKGKDLG